MTPSLHPVPSPQLLQVLRCILRSSPILHYQSRTVAQSTFRKPNNITALDKLHRRQKQADRQEVIDSYNRAVAVQATFSSSQPPSSPSSDSDQQVQIRQLPYYIHRTPSQRLPIYHEAKRGGNMHLTLVRKLSGDLELLRKDLSVALGLGKVLVKGRKVEGVRINWITRQIIVRGWRAPEVRVWAQGKGF